MEDGEIALAAPMWLPEEARKPSCEGCARYDHTVEKCVATHSGCGDDKFFGHKSAKCTTRDTRGDGDDFRSVRSSSADYRANNRSHGRSYTPDSRRYFGGSNGSPNRINKPGICWY